MPMPDTITVLRCAEGLRMCKLIRETGEVVGYDSARHFDAAEVVVSGIDHLGERIAALLHKPRCCVVRGSLIAGPKAKRIRRLLYAEKATGDIATFNDVPRSWLALDMDDLPMPANVQGADVAACAAYAVSTLPPAFHAARCYAQASASHGIKDGIRLRLWFWLSRPLTGAELKRWLAGVTTDTAVFGGVQPIYTAAPIFENPDADPIAQRLVAMPGNAEVETPAAESLAEPPRPAYRPPPMPTDTGARKYAVVALTSAAIRVAGAPVNSRHMTAMNEARGLGRLVRAGLLTATQVSETIQGAIEQAGKTREEGALVAAWGIANPSGAQIPTGAG